MPWQFGQLGLTEDGGNRAIKYADALINGASPNDGNFSAAGITYVNVFRGYRLRNLRKPNSVEYLHV
jgi:mannan endo-1,4-beta-mannosidase